MTVTTIGYGDLVPTNAAEEWVCIGIMFVGCCIYAFLVGTIVSSLSGADPAGHDYQRDIENLDDLLKKSAAASMSSRVAMVGRARGRCCGNRCRRRCLQIQSAAAALAPLVGAGRRRSGDTRTRRGGGSVVDVGKMHDFFSKRKATYEHKYFSAVLELCSPGIRACFMNHLYGSSLLQLPAFSLPPVRTLQGRLGGGGGGGDDDAAMVAANYRFFLSELAVLLEAEAFPAMEHLITYGAWI